MFRSDSASQGPMVRRTQTGTFAANRKRAGNQLPIEFATLVNVVLEFEPTDLIAAKHTITISASMTAYSTAVGPSPDVKNRTANRP
jgi:hypothetical protein